MVLIMRKRPVDVKYTVAEIISPNKFILKERPGEVLPSYYFMTLENAIEEAKDELRWLTW